jgi:hypothetical protein
MIVQEKNLDFKRFEQEVFKKFCEMGCLFIGRQLKRWDDWLMLHRDRNEYRHKGLRETTIKTVLGEVPIERAIYKTTTPDGKTAHVYLLDEALGLGGSGFFSDYLMEMIANAACESSFRATASAISEMTGQTISHTAAWNVVQQLGGRLDEKEQEAASLAANFNGKGELETKVLFEELDGIHLNLQGESRKKHGASKEMKAAIAYDGAEKVGKKRYRLTNKVATANFESAKRFRIRKEGAIAATYRVDEIDARLMNGDGANWINESAMPDTHFQLDHFHISQAITRYVSNDEARKLIRNLLYSKQIDTLLDVIEAYSNSAEDEKEQENYLKLLTYFSNNKDFLVPCHRRSLDLPEPPDGKEYRRMGAMESNIFTIIGNRMKGRRFCWSINGANNLARLLCLKTTEKLSEALQKLGSLVLPERYAEEIEIKMSAAGIPSREGKGYNGFQQATVPPSMPWMKDLAALRPLSQMQLKNPTFTIKNKSFPVK